MCNYFIERKKESMDEICTYIVCLPSRRKHVNQFVSALGVQGAQFPPVTMKDDLIYESLQRRKIISADFPRKTAWLGKVACSLSHLTVCEQFLRDNAKFALVFEDDNEIPTPDEASAFWKSIGYLLKTPGWDFLNLSPCLSSACPVVMTTWPRLYAGDSFCQNAYIMNRTAAEALISIAFPLTFKEHALDTKYKYLQSRGVRYYLHHPRIIRQKVGAHLATTNDNPNENKECAPWVSTYVHLGPIHFYWPNSWSALLFAICAVMWSLCMLKILCVF